MSQIKIRSALEKSLSLITPTVDTWYEGFKYTPTTGKPYQSANLIIATENPTTGIDFYRERGIFQVTLRYPLDKGTSDAMTQAEKIQNVFKCGSSHSKDDIRVLCYKTPEIRMLPNEVDRLVIAVRVFFTADIFL